MESKKKSIHKGLWDIGRGFGTRIVKPGRPTRVRGRRGGGGGKRGTGDVLTKRNWTERGNLLSLLADNYREREKKRKKKGG